MPNIIHKILCTIYVYNNIQKIIWNSIFIWKSLQTQKSDYSGDYMRSVFPLCFLLFHALPQPINDRLDDNDHQRTGRWVTYPHREEPRGQHEPDRDPKHKARVQILLEPRFEFKAFASLLKNTINSIRKPVAVIIYDAKYNFGN